MQRPIITLTPEQIAFADKRARQRREMAIVRKRRPGNKAPTDSAAALAMDILGMRCECAGYVWLKPVKWHCEIVENVCGLPDLHDFIDVKGVDKANKNLIVKPGDNPDWAYLLVLGHDHPRYTIFGWCWGREAMSKPIEERSPGRRNFFVNQGDRMMKDPSDLELELRIRQGSVPRQQPAIIVNPGRFSFYNNHICTAPGCTKYGVHGVEGFAKIEAIKWRCREHC